MYNVRNFDFFVVVSIVWSLGGAVLLLAESMSVFSLSASSATNWEFFFSLILPKTPN
jgi:hypothetical protein